MTAGGVSQTRKLVQKITYKPIKTMKELFSITKKKLKGVEEIKIKEKGNKIVVTLPLYGMFLPQDVEYTFLSNDTIKIEYVAKDKITKNGEEQFLDIDILKEIKLPAKVDFTKAKIIEKKDKVLLVVPKIETA